MDKAAVQALAAEFQDVDVLFNCVGWGLFFFFCTLKLIKTSAELPNQYR